jgi:hypothetical protein
MRCLRGTLAAADSRAMLISCHLKGMSDKWKHPRHRPHPLKLVSRIFTQFISLRDVEERISEINIEDEIGKFKRNAPHFSGILAAPEESSDSRPTQKPIY